MVEQNVNYKDIKFHLERCVEMCNVYSKGNSKTHFEYYDYSLQTLRTIYTLYYSPCYITFVTDVIDILRTMPVHQYTTNKNKIFSLLIEQMSKVID